MDAICRLCLKLNNKQQMWELTDDCDILRKIQLCFSFNIIINKPFPNQLCKDCVNKIEDMYTFWTDIKQNEQKLQQHFKNNTLNDYYMILINICIKEDCGDKTIGLHKEDIYLNEQNVNKNDKIKTDLKYDTDLESKKDTINISAELFKDEIEITNMTYSSEDDDNEKIKTKLKNKSVRKSKKDTIDTSTESFKDDNQISNDIIYSSEDDDNVSLSVLKEKKCTSNLGNKEIESNKKINRLIYVHQNYRCLTCDKVYDSHDKLRDHYKEEHSNINSETIDKLYTEKVVNGKIMYKCEKCDKVTLKKYIKAHVAYHINERPYICKLCGRTYKTTTDIMLHGYRAHSDTKFYCSYKCGYSTAYATGLKDHENNIHKKKFKYTCEKCGKGFSVKPWYEQHQNIHNGVKPFVCDICGASFHMDKYLRFHRSRLHPQSKSKKCLACPQCDLKCDSVFSLALHLENEHGVPRKKRHNRLKKTLCHVCGKILNRPEQLLHHRRMHLGEKPYSCSICSKSFRSKFSRGVHERAHARVHRHACAHCVRSYSQPSALYRHLRINHGITRKIASELKPDS